MNRLFSAAWVIARRDYVAAVFSRTFLFFLIGPILIFAVTGLVTVMAGSSKKAPSEPLVVLAFDAGDVAALDQARSQLVQRMGRDFLPDTQIADPVTPTEAEALLRRDRSLSAVLSGTLFHPVLTSAGHAPDDVAAPLGLLVDTARARILLGGAAAIPTAIDRHELALPKAQASGDRTDLAQAAQFALFFFILLLAGMLLSNFVEEKGNKVIEVLAAAAPVDAIFLGKLAGMLAISTTAIGIWLAGGGIGLVLLAPKMLAGFAAPAVGWPLFLVLGVLYFVMVYLLIGAVFLGLGSQASSPREVQMMSMPVTMGQALLFAFASAGAAHPDGWVAIAAAIFPWSSPLAMIGRAAETPALWTHLAALLWQAAWLALAIRFAARRFRVAVLKSGGGGGGGGKAKAGRTRRVFGPR